VRRELQAQSVSAAPQVVLSPVPQKQSEVTEYAQVHLSEWMTPDESSRRFCACTRSDRSGVPRPVRSRLAPRRDVVQDRVVALARRSWDVLVGVVMVMVVRDTATGYKKGRSRRFETIITLSGTRVYAASAYTSTTIRPQIIF